MVACSYALCIYATCIKDSQYAGKEIRPKVVKHMFEETKEPNTYPPFLNQQGSQYNSFSSIWHQLH